MKTCADCRWSDVEERYNDHDYWWEIGGCRKDLEFSNDRDQDMSDCPGFEE